MSIETTEPVKKEPSRKKTASNGALSHGSLTKEQLLDIQKKLWFVRLFDSTLYDLKKKGRIARGEIYSCRGQEAVIVGTMFPLRQDDYISAIHRDLPGFVLKGMSSREVMSQVFGKYTAPGKSKDVWTHFGDMTKGIIHSTSMLASTVPVATGVAQALVMDGKDSVVISYMGEGATARGDLHEGLNYAAIHKLPLIVVVENNQWSYSTPVSLGCPTPHVADRAKGFGIPGWTVDGQNVLEVIDTMNLAIERARAGQGPSIVECVTYRINGHATHDDTKAQQYRPKDQQEEWNQATKDPINVFCKHLIDMGFNESELLKEADETTKAEIADAVEFATNAPLAPAEEGFLDIYDDSAGVSA